MRQTGLSARRTAHHLLMQIIDEGRLMSELVGSGALASLGPEDRARAQRLATEALRGLDRADRMLKPYIKKTPPTHVMNALRLGVIELCSGAAAHGVVNAYVEIVARNKRTQAMKGLTNAVLRKIADEGPEGWAKRALPLTPGWLRQPLVAAWGREAVTGIEVAHFAGAPLDLTARTDPVALADAVGGTVLPTGSVRLADHGQVSALPGYETGDWWVQDAAAALPVKLLGDVTGLRVLDLCAAPGGKTLQLAAGGAQVTAVDMSARRMARVQENLQRTGLQAKTVISDAFEYDEGGYDAVLLDAPCSATGTIRRHPDLPYAKDGSEFGALIAQQETMIDHALTLLKPGGRLVFCTCSLLPDEGEVQVEDALERHPHLQADRSALDIPGVDPAWITDEGGLRLRPDYWPDLGGMDGFYMSVLRHNAA
ncbi:RsmB/NOP family class I SAM-dependent RNA methyltransferase [Yoonia sediminilitoris]|uniref:16S rRNA (Cytosine967-C5)-methyltransferase n=1 Tax=Yoonia sediminilitoris TaxID=1286148 RepID=A0A2T6KN32_9RHOB|nr:RsmB/NOP family class I SAM-dependent RNA methyltransferase [Yoonia sediminilitoris]PUB17591.1 16S rRNA (cytosine967-C5)-methyltransferase [Yoonia sediminilitoris]RCW97886.1 16S rRNA (cytosine967-C5)-methyltransferase [Yoonia sediminilitoris]